MNGIDQVISMCKCKVIIGHAQYKRCNWDVRLDMHDLYDTTVLPMLTQSLPLNFQTTFGFIDLNLTVAVYGQCPV